MAIAATREDEASNLFPGSRTMTNTRPRLFGTCCVCALLAVNWCAAAIPVTGIDDQEVYTDRVTFTVPSAAGYEYTTLALTSEPVATAIPVVLNQPVQVTQPQYYELNVTRRLISSGATESARIRFIIKATERKDAEWGLPPWVAYPMINSAAAEFAGSTLTVVAPAAYPQGIAIPVIAFVRNQAGKRVGVNGDVTASAFPGHVLELVRGVGSALLPAATAAGTLPYDVSVKTIAASRQIAIDASTSWQNAPTTITSTTTWGPNARVSIGSDITINSGVTLTIAAGTVVRLAPGAQINVNGVLTISGTLGQPVVLTPANRTAPWGGLVFKGSAARGTITGAIMTASGADPDWFDNNPGSGTTHLSNECLFYLSGGARVTFTDSWLVDHFGQAGHGESSYLTMTRCLVQKFLTFGEYNGGEVQLNDCAIIEFPSKDAPFADDDSDGVYLTGGDHHIVDCLIGWAHDDGVDSGSGAGSPVEITRCWIESCYHEALAWSCDSGTRLPTITDTVTINSGQGIEAGWGNPRVEANRCLSTANGIGARFGDNYDWDYNGFLHVTNSLLLHNLRDVWGRAWDTWEEHPAQMNVASNRLTVADPLHPDNAVWNPATDAELLAPFLPAPDDVVGIGIALRQSQLEMTQLSAGVPVRLSTFSRKTVSVRYQVTTDVGTSPSGTVEFLPGHTVRIIPLDIAQPENYAFVRVTLLEPVSAELTDLTQVTFAPDQTVAIVPKGATWKYWDKASDLGTAWRALGFNDTAWPSGPAELGFGDDDEATVIDGGADGDRTPTIYFRGKFTVADPSRFTALQINLRRDDGAVVYINDTEVFRTNMPAGAIAYTTWASSSGTDEDEYYVQAVATSVLVPGENIFACEVHQANADSSDLSFDLELLGERSLEPPAPGFIRGDANGDKRVDLSDAVQVLLVLFAAAPTDCQDSIDADDGGATDIGDAIYILSYLFAKGPAPKAPFPTAGEDTTADTLTCER